MRTPTHFFFCVLLGLILGAFGAWGAPPTITDINDLTINANSATPQLAFTIGDVETAASSLSLSSSSTNTLLVPVSRIVFSGSASNRFVRVTPANNQMGTTLIAITVTDTAGESAQAQFVVTVTNGPPTISDVPNRMINAGITSAVISFVVFDKETTPSNLVVSASSSVPSLISNQNIFLGGFGSNRTVRVKPQMQLGTATLTLTVMDVFGETASDAIVLTVTNSRPDPSVLGQLIVPMNAPGATKNFTVSDLESQAAALTVTGMSSNQTLVPDENLSFGGSGSNRSISLTPATNQVGRTTIAVVVTDELDGRRTNQLDLNVSQFIQTTNAMPGYGYASLAWGDYDNDGLQDFVLIGAGGPLTTSIYRNTGGAFTNIGVNLLEVYLGAVAWGDYDRDGDLDLTVSGITGAGTNSTVLYRNDGGGSFNAVATALPRLRFTGMAWGDYDNDGAPDLLIAGESNNVPVTKLFRNNNGVLADSGIVFPPVKMAAVAWGDFDNDGDLDLCLSGINSSGYGAQGRIYRNAGNGSFVDITSPIDGLARNGGGSGEGIAEWGDYDGDGDLDLLLHGGNSINFGYTWIYRNDGPAGFVKASVGMDYESRQGAGWADYDNDGDLDIGLGYRYEYFGTHFYRNDGGFYYDTTNNILGLGQGSLVWGDADSDGRLDLLQTGENYQATARAIRLFRNHGPVTNTPPTAPATIGAQVNGRTVRLSWPVASDVNQTNALTYNLRVGTAPGSGNICPPQSLADGRRLRPGLGNVGLNTAWRLRNLSPGTYYASVQAVDAGWLGSAFSPEISFTIASPPGPPSGITEMVTGITFSDATLNGVANANGAAASAWFQFGTTTNYGLKTSPVLIGASTNDVTLSTVITGLVATTTYHVRLAVSNAFGINFGDDRTFDTVPRTQFSEMDFGLVTSISGGGRWVDYDNDGDLDLASGGGKLMRNDGGVLTNTGVTSPSGNGMLGDFNRDNFVDQLGQFTVSQNNRNGAFTNFSLNLVPAPDNYSVGAWGDYDGDGAPDFVLTGSVVSNSYYATLLYRNLGDKLTNMTVQLPTVTDGARSAPGWLDYDGDGRLDMFISSIRFASQPCYIYRNLAGGIFVNNTNAFLGGDSGESRDWADYDNDGDLDLAVGAPLGTTTPLRTRIYRNDGNVAVDLGLTNIPISAQICWADFDNDGDADLSLVAPEPVYFRAVRLFRNDGGTFTDTGFKINGARLMSWGDFDGDGDLDLVVSGETEAQQSFVRVYRNNNLVSNAPPTAPTGLHSALAGNAIVLGWNQPTDDHQTNGWSYNLRVGTTPGGCDIMSPLANLTNGYRRLPGFGNAGVGTTWVLTNLPLNTFYWSVQAVDQSFAGSPFASEAIFIRPPRFTIQLLSNGLPQLTLVGEPLRQYRVEVSGNLADWVSPTNITAGSNGVVTFGEATAGYVRRYYRAVRLP